MIFKPAADSTGSDKQSGLCLEPYASSGTKCTVAVLTYKSGYLERFRRWRGPFWLNKETLTF